MPGEGSISQEPASVVVQGQQEQEVRKRSSSVANANASGNDTQFGSSSSDDNANGSATIDNSHAVGDDGDNEQLTDDVDEMRGRSKRKRRSRWSSAKHPTLLDPMLPRQIPADLPAKEKELLVKKLRVQELTSFILNKWVPPEEDRSPSPEPIYNQMGQRMNTREARYKRKFEQERHTLVQELVDKDPGFRPPPDYKPMSSRLEDIVPIPVNEHPHLNFMGILIGPRGATLRGLEAEYGVKIMIRGRKSVKDGRPIPQEFMEAEHDMYAVVQAEDPAKIKRGVDKLNELMTHAIETPEDQNEVKKFQLRQLAILNGTWRDEDEQLFRCQKCGSTLHKTYQCTERENFTNELHCDRCHGVGHLAADCKAHLILNEVETPAPVATEDMDDDFLSLMEELGEAPKRKPKAPEAQKEAPATKPPVPAPPATTAATTAILGAPPSTSSTSSLLGSPPSTSSTTTTIIQATVPSSSAPAPSTSSTVSTKTTVISVPAIKPSSQPRPFHQQQKPLNTLPPPPPHLISGPNPRLPPPPAHNQPLPPPPTHSQHQPFGLPPPPNPWTPPSTFNGPPPAFGYGQQYPPPSYNDYQYYDPQQQYQHYGNQYQPPPPPPPPQGH